MAQRLKFRNQTNTKLLTQRRKLSRSVTCGRISSMPEFRMRLESEVVINLENQNVDSLFRECFEVLSERVQISVSVVVEEVNRTPWFRRSRLCRCDKRNQHQDQCDDTTFVRDCFHRPMGFPVSLACLMHSCFADSARAT